MSRQSFWAVLTKFVPRMLTDCHFAASDQSSDIAIRFCNPELLTTYHVFAGQLYGGGTYLPVVMRGPWAEMYHVWGIHGPSSILTKAGLDFGHLVLFLSAGFSKATGILKVRPNFALVALVKN